MSANDSSRIAISATSGATSSISPKHLTSKQRLRGLDGQSTKTVRIASVHFFADFCSFIATDQFYASPPCCFSRKS